MFTFMSCQHPLEWTFEHIRLLYAWTNDYLIHELRLRNVRFRDNAIKDELIMLLFN